MPQRLAHHCTVARCDMLLSMAVLLLWIAQPAQAARQGRYAPLIRKAHTWTAERVVAAGDSLLSRGDWAEPGDTSTSCAPASTPRHPSMPT